MYWLSIETTVNATDGAENKFCRISFSVFRDINIWLGSFVALFLNISFASMNIFEFFGRLLVCTAMSGYKELGK